MSESIDRAVKALAAQRKEAAELRDNTMPISRIDGINPGKMRK